MGATAWTVLHALVIAHVTCAAGAAGAAGAAVEWWLESSAVRVLGHTRTATFTGLDRISLAQNEHESFQLCLRPGDGEGVNTSFAVTVSSPTPGLRVTWEQVGLVYVPGEKRAT